MASSHMNAAIMGDVNATSSLINDQSAEQLLRLRVPNLGNTILHLASELGDVEAVETILSKHSLLLCKVNSDGDTALHLAARGGHNDVVCVLIDCSIKLENERPQRWQLMELKNKEGNMAVHEATRYNRIQVVTILLQDPGFKHSGNELGETPLYLAASRGFHDLVDVIINASESPSYDGPSRRTALHGAVICNSQECTAKLLQWDESLVQHKDKYSETPLHCAARLGFVNLIRELLLVDASAAYQTNFKERNVLHIAIEHEHKDVIEYLLEECPSLVNNLIIKKDVYGDTPLHLLATSNCFLPKLIHHPLADKGALNDKEWTPLDLVISNDNELSTAAAKNQIAEELRSAGAILHRIAPFPRFRRSDLTRKMVENHMIVAALIATVAFTAGFAMSGGYIQSGSPNQGMAVLSRNSVAFQAFVISDAVAMLCSTSALFTYILSAVFDDGTEECEELENFASFAFILNMFGLGAIVVSFIAATYAVLQYSHALAIATLVVASYTFYMYFSLILLPFPTEDTGGGG